MLLDPDPHSQSRIRIQDNLINADSDPQHCFNQNTMPLSSQERFSHFI